MEPERMRERFAAARVATLASLRPEGDPHAVPVCFALIGETIVSAVDAKPKRTSDLARLANLRANPGVELLAHFYEEDWSRLWWVRVAGRAAILPDGEERSAALRALATKYPQYTLAPPKGPVIAVKELRWSGWSANGL